MTRSYVVTGGGKGIGRAIVERLLADEANHVVVVELHADTLNWLDETPSATAVVGNASDEQVAEDAIDRASAEGTFSGWVNNAALFRDASVHDTPAPEILDLISLNLSPVVVGCTAAVRRFLADGTAGSIVNMSSHQARQAVPGATPYVTAKAAIEGFTRALSVEYGPRGIRVNAVAPGSVETERYAEFVQAHPEIAEEMARLHPLGRVARASEIADAVGYLLSDGAGFVNGATLPVDGGRSVLAHDPEAR